MGKIFLDVFDYSGKKLATLYDSQAVVPGSAENIEITYELTGGRKLSFQMPYIVEKKSNFRWQYIQSEYKVRVIDNGKEDWFLITNPKKQKGSRKIYGDITCDHLSSTLKTKNLYLYFDQDNGIGEAPDLMDQIMAGTGWTFDKDGSDVFYENSGSIGEGKPKVRSLKSDTKTGAYALIGKVCDLFNAYPVFDAVNRSVSLHDLNNKKPLWEMTMGRNLTALSVDYDSSDIITRLYVEGDFDDDDYIGIQDVNPTGLSYLMNFDYYKQIGAFTDEHQAALDAYYSSIRSAKSETATVSSALVNKKSHLTSLWGTQRFVLWSVQNGTRTDKITGGTEQIQAQDEQIVYGDKIYVFYHDESLVSKKDRFKIVTVDSETRVGVGAFAYTNYPFIGQNGVVTYVMKWIDACSGSIGAKEVAIEAKQKVIDECVKDNAKEITSEKDKVKNNSTIISCESAINTILFGSNEVQSFAYDAKVAGQVSIRNNEKATAKICRQSVNSTLNTTTYYISGTATVKTTGTVTPQQNTRLVFTVTQAGKETIYAVTDSLQISEDTVSANIMNLDPAILNCSTASKECVISLKDGVGGVDLSGAMFVITVNAIAYGLYEQYAQAVALAFQVDNLQKAYDSYVAQQENIEADFMSIVGDMLKDGYWTDDAYSAGQETYLYNDALDVMKEVSKPKVKYSVTMLNLSQEMGQTPDQVQLNSKIRIYDPELNINDTVYISKITYGLDDPTKDSVQISNEEVSVSSSFDSIFSRISDVANLVEQKKSIFQRSQAITSDGMTPANRLQGAISILTNKLASSSSSWYTDDAGNIVFESVDGKSAMMLCGEGFMIASGKTQNGSWNFRTFGTGQGFTADAIIAGYLSADRIDARSITAQKLASDVGKSLDLSSNTSIMLTVGDIVSGEKGYKMNISSDNGYFISNDNVINLTALFTDSGEDVTEQNKEYIKWYMNGDLYRQGDLSIEIDSDMFDSILDIECRITKYIQTGKYDMSGKQIVEERTYYDKVSVSKIYDSSNVQVYTSSNLSTTQVFDPNLNGGYQPDWRNTPFVIVPKIFVNGQEYSAASNDITTKWKKIINGEEKELDNDIESADSITGCLVVSDNVMDVGTPSVSYVCYVKYKGKNTARCTIQCDLVMTKYKEKFCQINGINAFKYDNGVVNPNTIQLTVQCSNCVMTKWQYKNTDGEFVDIDLSDTRYVQSGSLQRIRISPSSTMFVGNLSDDFYSTCTIMAVTNTEHVYDIFSIHKMTNGQTSNDIQYYSFVKYSAYDDGYQMVDHPTTQTKYIGMYTGWVGDQSKLTKQNYLWMKYSGSDVQVQNVVVEYKQISHDELDGYQNIYEGWTDTCPETQEGKYIATRKTISYNNGETEIKYGVKYNDKTDSGKTYHTYIRYSAYSSGKNMTIQPQTDSSYIGFYTGLASSAPSNYSMYNWVLIAKQDAKIASVSVMYAVTDSQEHPDQDDETAWRDSVPSISQGQYLWAKTKTVYTTGIEYIAYSVSKSGTNGQNTTTVFLLDEHVWFPATANGVCGYTAVKTQLCAYRGVTAVEPIVMVDEGFSFYDEDGIPGISERKVCPNGMRVQIGRMDSETKRIPIIIRISDGSTLNTSDSTGGKILIPVRVSFSGKVYEQNVVLMWNKINMNITSQNSMVFSLYAPYGNIFDSSKSILPVNASAYYGAEDVSSSAKFEWYIYSTQLRGSDLYVDRIEPVLDNDRQLTVNGIGTNQKQKLPELYMDDDMDLYAIPFEYTTLSIDEDMDLVYDEDEITGDDATVIKWHPYESDKSPIGHSRISVASSDILGSGVFKCVMTYNGIEYTSFITILDKSERYQAVIVSSGGTSFTSYDGTTQLLCTIYETGKQIEDTGAYSFVWYKLDNNGNATTLNSSTNRQQISINDIGECSTYFCSCSIGATGSLVLTHSDIGIIRSDTQPEQPYDNMMWLDTSEIPNMLKRYDQSEQRWINCSAYASEFVDKKTYETQLLQLQDSITASVTSQAYNEKMQTIEQAISKMTLTDNGFIASYNNLIKPSIGVDVSAAVQDTLQNYLKWDAQNNVLQLGSSQSNFKTQITNTEMDFLNGGTKVAWIGNSNMYITTARVTDALYIGDTTNGHFNWTVTETGLGLKWVGING